MEVNRFSKKQAAASTGQMMSIKEQAAAKWIQAKWRQKREWENVVLMSMGGDFDAELTGETEHGDSVDNGSGGSGSTQAAAKPPKHQLPLPSAGKKLAPGQKLAPPPLRSKRDADEASSMLHVRGVGTTSEEELVQIFSRYGKCVQATVRVRWTDAGNTSWALVTMADRRFLMSMGGDFDAELTGETEPQPEPQIQSSAACIDGRPQWEFFGKRRAGCWQNIPREESSSSSSSSDSDDEFIGGQVHLGSSGVCCPSGTQPRLRSISGGVLQLVAAGAGPRSPSQQPQLAQRMASTSPAVSQRAIARSQSQILRERGLVPALLSTQARSLH